MAYFDSTRLSASGIDDEPFTQPVLPSFTGFYLVLLGFT